MIEVKGNLWTYKADWRAITTNGTVKKNGQCVMGRGCAREADLQYGIAKMLGSHIKEHGNIVWAWPTEKLIFFPVKHNWYEKADIELIEKSTNSFLNMISAWPELTFVIPRPGCGNGGLKWEEVRPILEPLPDNVKVITHD